MAKLKEPFWVAAVLLGLISYALTKPGNSDISLILNKLNSVRSNVNPSASNMNKLVWNEKLAAAAQLFSRTCKLNSNPDRITSFNTVGETWGAIGSPTPDYSLIIDVAWLRQRSLYSFETNTCNPDDTCAFYTQLVWAGTTDVGCGSTFCPIIEQFSVPNSTTFYCYYGPAGNIPGESPYQIGTPCSECRADQICSNSLCGLPAGRNLAYTQNGSNFMISWEASPQNFRNFCINVTSSAMPSIPVISRCDMNQSFFSYQLQFSVKCIPIKVNIMEIDYSGIAQTNSLSYDSCSESCRPTLATCDDPPAPVDGYVSSYDNTNENSVVTFWCDPGYYLSPPVSFSTCTNSGSWVPEPAFTKCLAVPTCNDQMDPKISAASKAAVVVVVSFVSFITGAVATTLALRLYFGDKNIKTCLKCKWNSRDKKPKLNLHVEN